jgi:hypothetical protein
MIEALPRATRHNITEDAILHSRREKLKSYTTKATQSTASPDILLSVTDGAGNTGRTLYILHSVATIFH